jgi:TPR repeat protein
MTVSRPRAPQDAHPPSPLIIALVTIVSFLIGFSVHEWGWHGSPSPPHGNLQVAEQAFQSGNDQEALALFTRLADHNDPAAEYWLGHMTELGLGVPRNRQKAIDLYKKSASQDFAAAELRLGEIYLHGDVIPQDFALAKTYLEKAAYHGDARAAMLLGQVYRSGLGVPADPKEAYAWSEVASIEGSAFAKSERDASLKNLDVADQKAAVTRASDILAEIKHETNASAQQKPS